MWDSRRRRIAISLARLAASALLVSATPVLRAQESSPVKQENSYWVQTVTGSLDVASVAKLKVSTSGIIRLHGQEQPRLEYVLRKRARASARQEAEQRLAAIAVRAERSGSALVLAVTAAVLDASSLELDVRAPSRLPAAYLETLEGRIVVDGIGCSVVAESGGGSVQADRIGGSFKARTVGGEIEVGAVAGQLRCVTGSGNIRAGRSGSEAWFDTAGGSVYVEEAMGPVHAVTGGGDIDIRRAGSSVWARTGGGLIRILQAFGPVDVESAGGSIQIGAAAGVRCQSASGGIRLRGVSGGLNVSTSAGSILAELLGGAAIRDSFLNTNSGDITIQIPSNLAVTVSALNYSPGRRGRIISDFPEINVQVPARSGGAPVIAEGALNGGGPVLKIAAAEGTIFLRRQK